MIGANDFQVLVRHYFKGWARSRAPWIWALLVAVFAWGNWESMAGGAADAADWSGWWFALAAYAGFLAGYDTYRRTRENGSLRLILLHPVRRGVLAASQLAGGALLSGTVVLLFMGYLAATGRADLGGLALGCVLALLGALAFVAYAQLGSLLLPRETIAVLGFVLIAVGMRPLAAWLPADAPGWARLPVQVLDPLLPLAHRLVGALTAEGSVWKAIAITLVQIVAATILIRYLLDRRSLLARSREA